MDLENTFTVQAPIDDVWAAFLEPDRVAPCFPGATLKDHDNTSFTGTVKLKLGPVSMLYKGTGTYVETDADARRAVIKANGKDSRGNGQANATVTMTLAEESPGATNVVVLTDLSITGKPAQLGRGIITEVGAKIMGQFADCLGQRLGAESEAAVAEEGPTGPTTGAREDSVAGGAAGAPGFDGDVVEEAKAELTATGALEAEQEGLITASAPQAGESEPPPSVPSDGFRAPSENSVASAEPAASPQPAASSKPRRTVDYPPTPDAIDLLDTGGSAVVKRVAPVAAGAVVGGLLVWLVTRRR